MRQYVCSHISETECIIIPLQRTASPGPFLIGTTVPKSKINCASNLGVVPLRIPGRLIRDDSSINLQHLLLLQGLSAGHSDGAV
jgi:hypothetical protein